MYPDLFAFHINYDQVYDPENLYPGVVEGLYNGNISETYWLSSTDNTIRKYGYRYDKLNRLQDAYFQQPYSLDYNCQSYNEHLSYDKNGNILSLLRKGRIDAFPIAQEIDDLDYFYQGNQLTKVTDKSGFPQGFKDDSDGTNDINDDYAYDAFGNMVHDENKNIELIRHNHLNLPVEILFENGSTIHYLYNAAGQKLRKIVTDLGEAGGVSTTEYLDGFQYNNFILQFFSHPEGYVLNTPDRNGDPSFDYVYQYKDHLGNIRMNFLLYYPEGSFVIPHLRVLEENHYYPFGLKHENYNTERRKMTWDVKLEGGEEIDFKKLQQVPNSGYQYKYNGKEWQDELGLNEYDYGARGYMPDIVRWRQIDPLAEMYSEMSPYSFVGANPIQNLEVDGRWWFSKSSNNNTIRNGPNKVKISGASQYAFKMSSVRSVHKKQTGVASYIPVIGNWLNGSAMAQKVEDPTMKLDKGDVASLVLGGYFKATRGLIKKLGGLVGGGKLALDISEASTKLLTQINSSPELKESWVELAVMEHFAGATSEGGNSIGTLRGAKETDYTTTFSFSEDFIGELQSNYGNEFDSLDDTSGMNRDTFIDSKVQGHLQNMFESKKSEIMNLLEEK